MQAQHMHLTFDTLAYANKLKKAGFEPKLAEAQAEAQAEVFSELLENKLATKQDLFDVRTELKSEINEVRVQLTGETNGTRAKIDHLENKLDNLETKLLVKLGSVMAAGVGVLAALITLVPHH